jgi:hypothetical protein
MRDSERLERYAERWFQRHMRTEFPTVRRAARSLGWTQERVEMACEDSGYRVTLASYLGETSLAEHVVEVDNEPASAENR